MSRRMEINGPGFLLLLSLSLVSCFLSFALGTVLATREPRVPPARYEAKEYVLLSPSGTKVAYLHAPVNNEPELVVLGEQTRVMKRIPLSD